jgi:hypothetical protein
MSEKNGSLSVGSEPPLWAPPYGASFGAALLSAALENWSVSAVEK